MALLGVAQFGVVVGLLNYALQFIPSARAALLFATFPLLTMLIEALAGYERMTLVKTAGTLVAIGGVALALGDKALSGGGSGGWAGEIAALLSVLTGAICSVLYRPYLRKYKTVSVSAYAMAAAVLFLAVMAALDGSLGAGWPVFTPGAWLAVLFIGVNSGIGYYLWLWALSRAAATNVTVFLTLSPVTAAVLGALLLAEPLPLATVAGIVAVVGGLVLALRRQA
ncbi:MAG: DMT family transporter [Chloroflexi bacterium]|nr:DMT family transporter [Chloroflexota bacterium]